MKDLLIRAAHNGVAQVLGTILFLAGAGIGLSLIFATHTFTTFGVLSQNFRWVSPPAWGTLFIVASLALVVTVWADQEHAQLPALILGLLFIVFGLLALWTGTHPIIWAFSALGCISIFTQIVCWAKEKRESRERREELLYSYQPH